MKQFNRSQREYKSNIHPRLDQLNRELYVERTKTFDYVYATGKGLKVRCCVMVDEDMKCMATAQFGGRAYKEYGTSPAGAYLSLSIRLKVAFAEMPAAKKAMVREEMGLEA